MIFEDNCGFLNRMKKMKLKIENNKRRMKKRNLKKLLKIGKIYKLKKETQIQLLCMHLVFNKKVG